MSNWALILGRQRESSAGGNRDTERLKESQQGVEVVLQLIGERLLETRVPPMAWPARYPDLNPIENPLDQLS